MSGETIVVTPPELVTISVDPPVSVSVSVSQAGIAGLSAYQIAVLNGFVGTEIEWVNSLQGEPGIGTAEMLWTSTNW